MPRSLVHEESFGSVRVFWLDRAGAVAALREAAGRLLQACPEVERIVLFGSLAEGRAVPGSDADILVIADSPGPWLERAQRYRAYLDGCGIGVDVFAYRPDEVERAPVAQAAIARGTVLAGR